MTGEASMQSLVSPSALADARHDVEREIDIFREDISEYDLATVAENLASFRMDVERLKGYVSACEAEIANRLETLSATKQDCGDFLICKYSGTKRYEYDLSKVDRILESARNYGPDLFKLTQSAFEPTFKVKKDALNRVLAFGGETAEIINRWSRKSRPGHASS
jgi:hypothetical protein